MPRLILIDSGGTARVVRRVAVVDAGGTTRIVRRAFVIDAGGTARLFYRNGAVITIDDQELENSQFTPTPGFAFVTYRLNSNGNVEFLRNIFSGGTVTSTLETWTDTPAIASEYEAMATVVSGSGATGTFGTWLALSSSRAWSLQQSGIGSKFTRILVQIRRAGEAVDDTANVDMLVTVESP